MSYGMMTTLLLFVLSSGFYWDGGIIPALVGRLLLFKAKLLLGPSITLGAFVVGQGSGLLIGKLLGISYIINRYIKLKRVSNHHKVSHFQFGWDRPFYYHKHPIPPLHHDWNQFPSIHFSQYNRRPYGTYAYDTSGYHPYSTPYQYYPGATGSEYYTGNYPYSPSYQQYNGLGGNAYPYSTTAPYNIYTTNYPAASYIPKHQTSAGTDAYESNESDDEGGYEAPDAETGRGNGGHGSFQETNSKYENESSEDDPQWGSPEVNLKSKDVDSRTTPAEQYIIDHFFKATNKEPGMSEEKKLDVLADLLRSQFHDEFLSAAEAGDLKSTSDVTTEAPLPVSTEAPVKKVKPRQKDSGKTKKKASKESGTEKKNTEDPVTLTSPLVDVFTTMDPGDLVPETFMKWLLDGYGNVDTLNEEPEFRLHTYTGIRRKRAAQEQNDDLTNLEVDKVTASFIQDIKNLFSIVSFLDINRCLEKMVCEIHSRGSSSSGATEYEKNIVTAFRIMDKIMPLDAAEVDSTTKYRQAAHVGQNSIAGGTADLCQKIFAVCGFSSQQIIQLGDIGVPAPGIGESVASSSNGAPPPVAFRNAEDLDANSGA